MRAGHAVARRGSCTRCAAGRHISPAGAAHIRPPGAAPDCAQLGCAPQTPACPPTAACPQSSATTQSMCAAGLSTRSEAVARCLATSSRLLIAGFRSGEAGQSRAGRSQLCIGVGLCSCHHAARGHASKTRSWAPAQHPAACMAALPAGLQQFHPLPHSQHLPGRPTACR